VFIAVQSTGLIEGQHQRGIDIKRLPRGDVTIYVPFRGGESFRAAALLHVALGNGPLSSRYRINGARPVCDVAAETCRTFYRIRERAIEGDRLPGRPIGIKYIRSARPGEKGRKEGERMNNACGEQLVVSNETDL